MEKFKAGELMDEIAHALDITPQMYDESTKVVRGISAHLKNQVSGIEIYKQGSFRLGTIIQPYKKNDFDVDLVVKFSVNKKLTNPSSIKQTLRSMLNTKHYETLLDDEKRRCWTLNIPSSLANFHVDLLPCVDEDESIKKTVSQTALRNTSIAITEIVDKEQKPYHYIWKTSNPDGYANWFAGINRNLYSHMQNADKQRLFKNNPHLFMDATSVSEEYTRTPLQKVIQILKRHRDVMYCNSSDNAPISIIITTLVTKIVEENNTNIINDTYELLNYVVDGLSFYAHLTTSGITSDFEECYKNKKLISKTMKEGKVFWSIQNPTNSMENLADKWNETPEKATEFFNWVQQVHNDLIDILDYTPEQIEAKIKYCLGERIGNKVFSKFNINNLANLQTKPLKFSNTTPKPYRC